MIYPQVLSTKEPTPPPINTPASFAHCGGKNEDAAGPLHGPHDHIKLDRESLRTPRELCVRPTPSRRAPCFLVDDLPGVHSDDVVHLVGALASTLGVERIVEASIIEGRDLGSLLGGDGGGSRSEEGEALGEHSAHQNKVQHHVTSPPATYTALSLNPPLASSSFSTWADIKLMLQALQRPPARSPSPIATESVWWSYLRTDAAFLLPA